MPRFVVIDALVFLSCEECSSRWTVIDTERTGEIVASYKSLRLAHNRAAKENLQLEATCQTKSQ